MTDYKQTQSRSSRKASRSAVWVGLLVLGLGLLLVGGFFLGQLDIVSSFLPSLSGVSEQREGELSIREPVQYELKDPLEIVLNSTEEDRSYLNLQLALKLERPQDLPIIKSLEPAIRDAVLPYLQELKPEELNGAHGVFLLREELLFRISKVTGNVRIEDVYITSMQIQ